MLLLSCREWENPVVNERNDFSPMIPIMSEAQGASLKYCGPPANLHGEHRRSHGVSLKTTPQPWFARQPELPPSHAVP
jgi:hypothetical protein